MKQGQFCFLSEQYYQDFPDDRLMKNKEIINGQAHNRPCFFAFPDQRNISIYWLVPVSSNAKKYKAVYGRKVEKYGRCNTIRFGTFLGKEAAFLIQNMCPVTQKYIKELYTDQNNHPIQMDHRIGTDVVRNAREVLEKVKRGANIVFPDILSIYGTLVRQLLQEKAEQKSTEIQSYRDMSITERLSAAKSEAGQRNDRPDTVCQQGPLKSDKGQNR